MQTNLPRIAWIGLGICIGLIAVMLFTAGGIAIGLQMTTPKTPAAMPVAVPQKEAMPPVVKVQEKTAEPVKVEAKKAGIDRKQLIGKWELAKSKITCFEFKEDGTGWGLSIVGDMEWSLDGDVCSIIMAGLLHKFHAEFPNKDRLILTEKNGNGDVLVLTRLTPEMEVERERTERERRIDMEKPWIELEKRLSGKQ